MTVSPTGRETGWSRQRARDALCGDTGLAALLLVGAALVFAALSRGVFLFGDDVLMYQVSESIVMRRSVAVTSPTREQAEQINPEAAPSFNAAAVPGDDGRGYAKYGIGLSLVAIPWQVAGEALASSAPRARQDADPYGNVKVGPRVFVVSQTNAAVGASVVACVFLLGRAVGYRQRTSVALALAAGFATPLLFYSGTFLSEPLTALALGLVILGLLRASGASDWGWKGQFGWLALSGFAAGLAVATRPAAGLALIPLGLWLLWQLWQANRSAGIGRATRMALAWGTPAAAWLALVAAYNWARFGSVFETGYGAEAEAYTTPLLTGVYGLLASPGRGLLWHAPVVFLSIAGAWWFYRRAPALALMLLGMLALSLLLYGRYYAWHGGGVWGPRFLVPLLPLLALPTGEVIERAWERRGLALAALACVALGLAVSALALLVPFDAYVVEYTSSAASLDRALWSVGGAPIVEHARSVLEGDITVDNAAARYASPRLAAFSALAGATGCAALGLAMAAAMRNERVSAGRRAGARRR